jgi:hypothetical protein
MSIEQVEAGTNEPTLAEIQQSWPATVDLATAGAAFGLSRSYSYELASRGTFPAKVIKVGSRHRVITASIISVLSTGGG